MDMETIRINNPEKAEITIGQGNFSFKTVKTIFETLVNTLPEIKCGVAMNEGDTGTTRFEGNDNNLIKQASETAQKIAAGHVFVIYMKNAFPIQISKALKEVPGVMNIYISTSNTIQILTAQTDLGRSVIGVVDGKHAEKVETEDEKKQRHEKLKEMFS